MSSNVFFLLINTDQIHDLIIKVQFSAQLTSIEFSVHARSISFSFILTGDAEVIGQILISLFEHNN